MSKIKVIIPAYNEEKIASGMLLKNPPAFRKLLLSTTILLIILLK
jgi:hypothetical protein